MYAEQEGDDREKELRVNSFISSFSKTCRIPLPGKVSQGFFSDLQKNGDSLLLQQVLSPFRTVLSRDPAVQMGFQHRSSAVFAANAVCSGLHQVCRQPEHQMDMPR